MRVLIVESDRETREAIAESLGANGVETILAEGCEEAFDLLRHSRELPDLILVDNWTRRRCAGAVRAQMLTDPRLATIPIVVLDSKAVPVAADLADLPRLPKPFGMSDLLGGVGREHAP